jgi:hypothetical protein
MTATTWVAGGAVAAAGVTVALSVLGTELLGKNAPVLSEAQVRAQLAEQGPAAVGSRAAAGPSSHPAGSPAAWTARDFTGGSVFAVCTHDQATLTDWIPAQGYRTDGYAAGPAAAASVRFASPSATMIVTVTCSRNRPKFSQSVTPAAAGVTPGVRPAGTQVTPSAAATATGDPGGGGRGDGGGGGHGADG